MIPDIKKRFENPLLVYPELAQAIWLNRAIVLAQVHYRLEKFKHSKSHIKDGKVWVYNSYPKWKKTNFPRRSVSTIQKAFTSLEEDKILLSWNYNRMKIDQTKRYTINYEHEIFDPTKSDNSSYQNDMMVMQDLHDHGVDSNRPIPETTTDTTPETNNNNTIWAFDNALWVNKSINKEYSFNDYWKLYPNKKWKQKAKQLFKKLITNKAKFDELIRWLNWYMNHYNDKNLKEERVAGYQQWDSFLERETWVDFIDYQSTTNTLDFAIAKSIEKLDVEILHKFLDERDWTRQTDEGIQIHKDTFELIYQRVEKLDGNWADPNSRHLLLK